MTKRLEFGYAMRRYASHVKEGREEDKQEEDKVEEMKEEFYWLQC